MLRALLSLLTFAKTSNDTSAAFNVVVSEQGLLERKEKDECRKLATTEYTVPQRQQWDAELFHQMQ